MHPQAPVQSRFVGSRRRHGGFSLVEVTMATGIASLGIVMLFGLLPSGLIIFRDAMNISVTSQIAQRLIQEAVQTDYDVLAEKSSSASKSTVATVINKEWRYFDEEGIELPSSEASRALYHVMTRVIPATSLPKSSFFGPNHSLATVTVQVAVNPSNRTIPLLPSTSGSLSGTISPKASIEYYTFNGHVAKSK